ncbi:MAG: ATP-binding protein [Acidobacteriota bacterium]
MASSPTVSRRLVYGSIAFGLFVLFDLALFGVLIFKSLSEREVDEVLLETQAEAQLLADQIAGGAERQQDRDLFTAVASQNLVSTYIDEMLSEKRIVEHVRIYDGEGTLVFESNSDRVRFRDGAPRLEEAGDAEIRTQEERRQFEEQLPGIEVPIGEYGGTLVVGLSTEMMDNRIEVLRRDLLRQASIIGGVSVLLLLTAYVIIWRLLRRSKRLEEQAARAERLAYVGTLASGLAHEIRNPLNSLNLNMQMLEEDLAGPANSGSGRLLSITRSEIGRLERLVSDFLSYARPRPPELEAVAVGELFDRTRQVMAGAEQSAKVRIEVRDETGGAQVRVDSEQIGQLLLNLVQNALAAVEETAGPAVVRLRAEPLGGGVILRVEDNGPGVPEGDRQKIFDLFYSNKKGGTGLGLAIVQRIAQNHDGHVEVSDRPGGGSVFSVYLPGARVARAS